MRGAIALALVTAVVAGWARAGDATPAPDPELARTLVGRAHDALREHTPAEAARWFDEADAAAPDPLWRLAAGEAWLAAGEADKAQRRLEAALGDELEAPARVEATRQLELARALAPLIAKARELEAAKSFVAAMSVWEDADRLGANARFVVAAARDADAAGREADARRLATLADAREDLDADDRRWVASVLARAAQPKTTVPPPAPDPVTPWVLLVGGGAIAAGGAVALLVAAGDWSDVRAMKARAADGVVFDATRAGAEARSDDARRWTTIGWIGIAVGAVAAGLGAGWLVAADAPTQSAEVVTLAPTRDGLWIGAGGSF